jgi:hypothetical protein
VVCESAWRSGVTVLCPLPWCNVCVYMVNAYVLVSSLCSACVSMCMDCEYRCPRALSLWCMTVSLCADCVRR